MADHEFNNEWVDRYVRDELSADEEAAFEEALLEDANLQAEVEAALGIRETLRLDAQANDSADVRQLPVRNQWNTLAMAASVLLAVVSTTLFWRASVETGQLREQVESLKQPRTVLQVPVDIMRSSGGTPDVIIQKPAGQGAVLLDIELSPAFQGLDRIAFELQNVSGESLLTWQGAPGVNGRASAVLNSETLPDSVLQLNLSDPSSDAREVRLLEFRSPPN